MSENEGAREAPAPLTDTLSGRLAILFALLVLTPTVVSIYLAWDSYVEHSSRAKLQVRQLATLTATYETKFFEDARDILQEIGNDPEFRDDRSGCEEVLVEAVENTPEFEAIGYFDIQGTKLCGSTDVFENVSNLEWLHRVRRFRSFAISDYTVAANSPYPVIIAAQAVYSAEGGFEGVLAASIRLHWLSAFMREVSLPPESVFFLVDGNGTILADRTFVTSQLDPAGTAAGEELADFGALSGIIGEEAAEEVMARGQTDFEATGADGVRRVFSSVALPHGDVSVLFGMPAYSAVGWLERDLMNTVLGLVAIWFAGIGAAWLGTRHLVTRWTTRLGGMALAYGRGDYAEGRDFHRAPRELRDLAGTLAIMARRIESREEELRASLDTKNVLLREIHHRVKNNLQIVSSLLNIRGGDLTSEADRSALAEVKAHVRALALAHRHLYEGDDVQRVELRAFMTELCQKTFSALSAGTRNVSLEIDLPEVHVPTDRAVPIALLVTEAMTNALKHAFPDGRRGTVRVAFAEAPDGTGTLTVADDGVGLPQGDRARRGIGLGLIEAFARQIEGRLEIDGPPGTVIRVVIDPPGATAGDGAETSPQPRPPEAGPGA